VKVGTLVARNLWCWVKAFVLVMAVPRVSEACAPSSAAWTAAFWLNARGGIPVGDARSALAAWLSEVREAPHVAAVVLIDQGDRMPAELWYGVSGKGLSPASEDCRRLFETACKDYARRHGEREAWCETSKLNIGSGGPLRGLLQVAATTQSPQQALFFGSHGTGYRAGTGEISSLHDAVQPSTGDVPSSTLPPEGQVTSYRALAPGFDRKQNSLDRLFMDEIDRVLADFRPSTIDVVGFDSCLMGTLEVSYTFRHGIKAMIASQGLTPKNGWAYDSLLDRLSGQGGPLEVAKKIAADNESASYFAGISVLAPESAEKLGQALERFAASAPNDLRTEKLRGARTHCQRKAFYYEPSIAGETFPHATAVDLHCLLTQLKSGAQNGSEQEVAVSEGLRYLDDLVAQEPRFGGVSGVSIYFPSSRARFDLDLDRDGLNPTAPHSPEFMRHFPLWNQLVRDYIERTNVDPPGIRYCGNGTELGRAPDAPAAASCRFRQPTYYTP
jgi:hypothetical protein